MCEVDHRDCPHSLAKYVNMNDVTPEDMLRLGGASSTLSLYEALKKVHRPGDDQALMPLLETAWAMKGRSTLTEEEWARYMVQGPPYRLRLAAPFRRSHAAGG